MWEFSELRFSGLRCLTWILLPETLAALLTVSRLPEAKDERRATEPAIRFPGLGGGDLLCA